MKEVMKKEQWVNQLPSLVYWYQNSMSRCSYGEAFVLLTGNTRNIKKAFKILYSQATHVMYLMKQYASQARDTNEINR